MACNTKPKSIRVTPAQAEIIKQRALERGLNESQYILEACTQNNRTITPEMAIKAQGYYNDLQYLINVFEKIENEYSKEISKIEKKMIEEKLNNLKEGVESLWEKF